MSGLTVLIRGGGDLASAAVYKLKRSGMRVVVCEIARPTCVRRTVSFCNAIYEGDWEIQVPVLTIPDREVRDFLKPDVFIDATISKKTPDYDTSWAPLVIGLGPSIVAGVHAHVVIETQRGHDLGSLIYAGEASPNTGIPGDIAGYQMERVLRAPRKGLACHHFRIGDHVNAGDTVMTVGGAEVKAAISGVLRGLIAPGLTVSEGQKIGDIDPRDNDRYCWSISDKGRNIAGGVLEAIMAFFASPN